MIEEEHDWIEELHQKTLKLGYLVEERLYDKSSHFQRVEVVKTKSHGKMLFCDGVVMISERDEFVYHEMMVHVPLFIHPCVKRVLVIGGGDGGSVREILKHHSVEVCHLVEIDELVIEACREHFDGVSETLDDYRVTVKVGDGVKYVAETDEKYDLVIVDSTDPVGPAAPLFGEKFYANVRKILNDGGIVVSQAESPYYDIVWQKTLLGIFKKLFARAAIYNYVNLTYPGGLWSFTYAAKDDLRPFGDFDAKRVAASEIKFRYYSEAVHRAAFALPAFQEKELRKYITPSKDIHN